MARPKTVALRRSPVRHHTTARERDLLSLQPAERGRGLAWFRTADGAVDQRFTLQLPPLEDHGPLR